MGSCGISFSDQGSNPGALHWKHGVLAIRPPGSPICLFLLFILSFFFFKFFIYFWLLWVFIATQGPSLVVERGGCSLLGDMVFLFQ